MTKDKFKLILAMALWGSIGIFVRQIPLSSAAIAMYRAIIGSLFLAALFLLRKRPLPAAAFRRNLPILLLSGTAIAANWILLFQAYRYTTVPIATLSYYFAPVFVMILSPFLLKERLTTRKFICILAAMAGMVLIIGIGGGDGQAYRHPVGIAYGLGAAALYAGVMLSNQFLRQIEGMEITLSQLAIAALVLIAYVAFTEGGSALVIPAASLPALILLGIVHTGICYYLYFSSMQGLGAQTVAVLSYIDPVSSVLFAGLFLGEQLGLLQMAGGILILGSALLGSRASDSRQISKHR